MDHELPQLDGHIELEKMLNYREITMEEEAMYKDDNDDGYEYEENVFEGEVSRERKL